MILSWRAVVQTDCANEAKMYFYHCPFYWLHAGVLTSVWKKTDHTVLAAAIRSHAIHAARISHGVTAQLPRGRIGKVENPTGESTSTWRTMASGVVITPRVWTLSVRGVSKAAAVSRRLFTSFSPGADYNFGEISRHWWAKALVIIDSIRSKHTEIMLLFDRLRKHPRKHKDGLRWHKTVLNHLIPSKRWIKMV